MSSLKKILPLAAISVLLWTQSAANAFTAKPDQNNGVPLGAIGAGHLELLPSGNFANIAINNNRSSSLRIGAAPPGTFFAFRSSDGERAIVKRLSDSAGVYAPEGALLTPGSISYEGLYPDAWLSYPEEELGVSLSLTAFSPIIPFNYRASVMPAAIFLFTVANHSERKQSASIAFSWENINGATGENFASTDRVKMAAFPFDSEKGGPPIGLRFGHKGKHRFESAWGEYVVAADCPATEEGISYLQWNPTSKEGAERFWEEFSDDGRLSNELSKKDMFYAGAAACAFELEPGASRLVPFVLAWSAPNFYADMQDMGNYYTEVWPNAKDTALVALTSWDALFKAVQSWHEKILSSSLPDWFKDQLINNLYVLTTGTFWTKDGRFSIMETPAGPMMGTLDQRFYSSIATLMMYPLLETIELKLFAETQNPENEGRIYHDLGSYRLDRPSTGTTDKNWTDLNPKFILMAWRNYQWIGDLEMLRELWPKIKKVAAYTIGQDTDGDALPNQQGRSTTYDDWAYFGSNSYASSIWIAALDALVRMADLFEEPSLAKEYGEVFVKAKASFEDELWNEEKGFYRLYNDSLSQAPEADHPPVSDASHAGQLAGQWYADFLDLGKLFPEDHIQQALKYMGELNDRPYGVAKGLNPDGSPSQNPESEGWGSESENGWPGYWPCHYGALAIANGLPEVGLAAAKKAYDGIYKENGLPWNQPLRWDLEKNATYGWGQDRYMASPSIWHVLYALEGFSISMPEKKLRVTPNPPKDWGVLRAPLLMPHNWGEMTYQSTIDEDGATVFINVAFDLNVEFRQFVVPGIEGVEKPYAYVNDGTIQLPSVRTFREGGRPLVLLTLSEPIKIGPKGLDIVVLTGPKKSP